MPIHLRWFEARDGRIYLPPDDETPCPKHCIEREANTLPEVDALQKRLQQETYEKCQRELMRDEDAFAAARQQTYDSLYTRMLSSATSEYEKEFLKYYLQVHRDEKRAEYQRRFLCDRAYFEQREFDKPKSREQIEEELDAL